MLTGLRGIAAVGVVATHVAYATGLYADPTWGRFWSRLEVGVPVFFVLSGFLLFRPWVVAAAMGSPPPGIGAYLRRRALRILPAYWATVVVAFAVIPTEVGSSGASLVRHLLLTQVYFESGQHRGLTQMWSVVAEVAFYLILPVVGLLVTRTGRRPWSDRPVAAGVVALAAVTPAWYVVTRTVVVLPLESIYWLPGFLDWFAAGMMLAIAVVRRERGRRVAWLEAVRAAPFSTLVVAGCVFAMMTTPVAGPATLVPLDLFEALAKNLGYLAVGVAMVATLTVAPESGHLGRVMTSRPLMWLGTVSYELFLCHLAVLAAVTRALGLPDFGGDPVVVFTLTLGASGLVAHLLHRFLGPGSRLIGRFRPRSRTDSRHRHRRDRDQAEQLHHR